MVDALAIAVILALPVAMIVAIVKGALRRDGGTGFAAMTAFHDFVPKDKQAAIEIVMEQKAGKSFQQQLSGDPPGKGKKDEPEQIHD